MKQKAVLAGIGMTTFGRHLDRSLSSLAHEAITQALNDAGLSIQDIQAVWGGNVGAPVMTGQVAIAAQTIVRGLGLGDVPVVNVENACATASTAFQQACTLVTLGAYDVVLAFGVEKLYHEDKARAMRVYAGCADTEHPEQLSAFVADGLAPGSAEPGPQGPQRSLFMDIYARWSRDYMAASGATPRHFAMVSAKNSRHGSLNPKAQFRDVLTTEQVLAGRLIAAPLTLTMCSPIGDGAAAAIIVSETAARRLGLTKPVRVSACELRSGADIGVGEPDLAARLAKTVFADAGVDPRDVDCVELHDATSPAELMCYESIGLCAPGEGPAFLESGATELGGRVPVNTSGGLVRKGHPIGATGLGQIYEIALQLRGEAGSRQVEGAKVGLIENGGGFIGRDVAAMVMTVLTR